uniref:Calcium homeostasis modulator family member 4 n=1 Tax=Accipiter nisus TaxID=211598 RepID=A0A8B9NLZ4_9AVES
IVSFRQLARGWQSKEVVVANAIIAILTIGGQQLFSFFTFSCPCHVGQNLIYGLAFLGVPALILLLVGYEGTIITGRALVAPVTWLAVTLINGSYYVCAMSEYVSVHYYGANPNVTASERRRILAEFPCSQLVPLELTRARDEVILLLRYQSQVAGWLLIAVVVITVFLSYCLASCFSPLSFLHFRYWSSYVHNEQQLFDEATDQHSRLYAMQHVKKFFGFVPGSENVKEIRTGWRGATRTNCMNKHLHVENGSNLFWLKAIARYLDIDFKIPRVFACLPTAPIANQDGKQISLCVVRFVLPVTNLQFSHTNVPINITVIKNY